MKTTSKHKRIEVPIYEAVVWLVVSEDMPAERDKMQDVFGPSPEGDYAALCCYSGGRQFGLFFSPSSLDVNTVAHEVFHLTHRILEWAGTNFDSQHHEHAALLNGFLMATVFKQLGWKGGRTPPPLTRKRQKAIKG